MGFKFIFFNKNVRFDYWRLEYSVTWTRGKTRSDVVLRWVLYNP